jgi:integrase/recombinase XerD
MRVLFGLDFLVGFPQSLALFTHAHVIAWRDRLERTPCAGSTLRRKLAALSSLFTYLCEKNAVFINLVDGVTRPKANNYRGKSPVLSDAQGSELTWGGSDA